MTPLAFPVTGFLDPGRLWLLAIIPLLVAAYIVLCAVWPKQPNKA